MKQAYQDSQFTVDGITGHRLERLLAFENDGSWSLYLKPEDLPWQRFFTDAGLGFWRESSEAELADEMDEPDLVDLGARFGVLGAEILAAHCTPEPRIEVSLEWARLCSSPRTFTSSTETLRFDFSRSVPDLDGNLVELLSSAEIDEEL